MVKIDLSEADEPKKGWNLHVTGLSVVFKAVERGEKEELKVD